MSKRSVLRLLSVAALVTVCLYPATSRAQGLPEAAATYSAAYPDGARLSGKIRVLATPKRADVYVDGFFAGFVDDFDGALQGLPATPGDHAVTLFLEGYRTVTRHIVVTSHATLKVRLEMDKLEPDQTSEPPPPPAGSRTGPSGHE
jgi:PEGA domain